MSKKKKPVVIGYDRNGNPIYDHPPITDEQRREREKRRRAMERAERDRRRRDFDYEEDTMETEPYGADPYGGQEMEEEPYRGERAHRSYESRGYENDLRREQPRKRKPNWLGHLLVILQLIASAVLAVLMWLIALFPNKILLAALCILGILWLIALIFQTSLHKGVRITGKIYSTLILLVLCVGIAYLLKTNSTLADVFGNRLEGLFTSNDPGKASGKEPFTVLVTGSDQYGEMVDTGERSDVNILVTVNPKTETIVMTTTPRDAYLPIPDGYDGAGQYDKLTHMGLQGIGCSETCLEDLYGIEVDYYLKVNFSGFTNIIDSLGGVSVYSDFDFVTIDGYQFYQGYNDVYGEAALSFVRERHAFEDGDMQRGRNQMYMMKAIIAKIESPALLANYMDVMTDVSHNFLSDMPQSLVSALIRKQLDGVEWTVVSNEVSGETGEESCYAAGGEVLSVVYLDDESVSAAASVMQSCIDGSKLDENGNVIGEGNGTIVEICAVQDAWRRRAVALRRPEVAFPRLCVSG